MHTAGHHHPGGQELHPSISKPPWLTAAPPASHSRALRAPGRLARDRARRVRAPQHARPAPPTTRDPTTRHDGTRSPGRATRPPAPHCPAPSGPAPGASIPDWWPSKEPGRRGGHEILWHLLYTVKWMKERVPIVFFTERSHSEQSHLGLTGSCETGGIALSEVREKCANSILVRFEPGKNPAKKKAKTQQRPNT